MNRFWSILFFLVPILGVASFVLAGLNIAPLKNCSLPSSYSAAGDTIDNLFDGIHYLSAFILLGTGLAIGFAMWKFDHRRDPDSKAAYIHHNTKLEVCWTIVPACILVFLAFYQMKSWTENKMDRPTMQIDGQTALRPPLLMVKAKQFGWEFHYAGADGEVETQDDVYIENLMVVPSGVDVVIQLESRDVIHSFYVPELRLKQDIVPGMTQFAWFNSREEGDIEIFCTELCGWGHYKMKADLKIVSPSEFATWIDELTAENQPTYAAETSETTAAANN